MPLPSQNAPYLTHPLATHLLSPLLLRFDDILPPDFEGDIRDRFNNYLEVVVLNDSAVSGVLKCINQGIVAPAIMALRIGLMGKMNYKDCGNNWDITVQLNTNAFVVAHQKVRSPSRFFLYNTILPFASHRHADVVFLESF